ncbi:MAG: efflux RND transporter permease subunit, partial [bacterium]
MVISSLSIKRPVFAAMLMLALVVLGIFSFQGLPVDQFPDVKWGLVQVSTRYPGASPETVERDISRPVEEALNTVEGVHTISSTSLPGFSSVLVEFELTEDPVERTQDVRDKIGQIGGEIPDDADAPVIQSFSESDEAVASLAIASTSLDYTQLTSFAEDTIKRRLEAVPGVGAVTVVGGQTRQVKITVDPTRLTAYGLGVDAVTRAVGNSNQEIGAGTVDNPALERDLTITGRISNPAEFGRIVVGRSAGKPVFLSQVATIEDTGARKRSAAFLDASPTVALDIQKVRGANTVEVVDGVIARAEQLKATLPPGTQLTVVRNNSEIVKGSIGEVKETLLLGALLTIAVVFLFLGSWRSTLITGLTLPIAIVSTFMVFKGLGFTFNVLSSMGLSISIGLLIDDAIVVRENIVRHLAKGKTPAQAALDGTQEIGMAVMATTFTLVCVFVPIAFMGGIVGKYFFQFGMVVAFAVLVSLLVSFTLDPMLSSIWHDPAIAREIAHLRGEPLPHRRGPGVILDMFHDFIENLSRRYERGIAWALRHTWAIHLMALVSLVGAGFLVTKVGVSFVPETDNSEVNVSVEAPESSSLAYTSEKVLEIDRLLAQIPEVKFRYATVGGSYSDGPIKGNILVKLVPIEERTRSQREMIAAVRPLLANVSGVRIGVMGQQGGGGGGSDVQVSITGPNATDLQVASEQIKSVMADVPGIVDVASSYKSARRSLDIDVDRQKAAWYDLGVGQIGGLLRGYLGEDAISRWEDANGEDHDVVLTLPDAWRGNTALLGQLQLTGRVNGDDVLVPLSQIATLKENLGQSRIEHRNLQRVISVSGNVQGRDSGGANAEFQTKLKALDLPASVALEDSGEGQQIKETAGYAMQAMLLAIIFIYLILASQFNSILQPFAIMASLPLSFIGMVLGLLIFGSTMNIMSMIGLIMLMGLVTKNAILLVEFTNQLRARGHDRIEA